MPVALVTNYIPPYRAPLYRLLAERYGVEVFCFGGEADYVAGHHRRARAPRSASAFPGPSCCAASSTPPTWARPRAVIATVSGRVALPAAWRGARRAQRPFVLWASLWRHPRTPAHALSFPLMRSMYRDAPAILTYGPHVSRYVARHRGSDRNVFVAPQAVEPDVFAPQRGRGEREHCATLHGISRRARLVLFVGRLVREKGVETLLQAWDVGCRDGEVLCLVGEGPLAGRERGPHVVYAGHIDRAALPVAYAAADAVVVPSLGHAAFLRAVGTRLQRGDAPGPRRHRQHGGRRGGRRPGP